MCHITGSLTLRLVKSCKNLERSCGTTIIVYSGDVIACSVVSARGTILYKLVSVCQRSL